MKINNYNNNTFNAHIKCGFDFLYLAKYTLPNLPLPNLLPKSKSSRQKLGSIDVNDTD